MNYLLDSDLQAAYIAAGDPTHMDWMGGTAKMSRIRHPSETVLFVEESSGTINDGECYLIQNAGTTPSSSGADFLAVRHDHTAKLPDTPDNPPPLTGADVTNGMYNSIARGNVSFCDGHADYVSRNYVNSPTLRHWDPTH
jgi:prepilin-type processing-associated H-X9-DG protein